VSPDFQLGGDSERVALTCAALGVRADDLDLPVPLDRVAYRAALATLEGRGITENGVLTTYGKAVETMPCDRPWAELLVHTDDDLLPAVAVMSGIESLHRMTREDRNLDGLVVPGSDHLTAYNVYAEAYRRYGYVGEVYGLPRHLFYEQVTEWAERRGVLLKSVEDAALAMASVYRAMRLQLPSEMPPARDETLRHFQDLLARVQPFSLVIDEQTPTGEEARVSKTSVCGSWGAIAGALRYFADRFGTPRASIEGTQIPRDLIRKYAVEHPSELIFLQDRAQTPLVRRRRVTYFDFELEREDEPLREWSGDDAAAARRALAGALASGAALHPAVRRHRPVIDQIREAWRRSGGATVQLDQPALAALYEAALGEVNSVHDWRASPITIDWESVMPSSDRAAWLSLPGAAEVRGRTVPLEYDVETDPTGANVSVVRLRLPEKLAYALDDEDIPELDRPVRFVVHRGARGSVRASTLGELRVKLAERPPREEESRDGKRDGRREASHGRGRKHRSPGKPPWKGRPRRGR
jgi:hypothetical protein